MSEQYPGGFVTKTFPTVSTTSAQGMWTLSQQAGYQKQGNWPVPFTPSASNYIENLFNTYVYDGVGSGTQNVVNGLDLSTNGGLVWFKFRSGSATETNNELYDTVRGANNFLVTNGTAAQVNDPSSLNSFNTDGFTIQGDPGISAAGSKYVAWSFRQQSKFFKVVSWTGTGATSRTITHGLGSVPGCVIVRAYTSAANWLVYHGSLGYTYYGTLNSTEPFYNNAVSQGLWTQAPTSTDFYIGDGVNASGVSYIAYFYASDAGGFGDYGTDSVVSCGTYNGNGGTGPTINLGWQPQWILLKQSTVAGGSAGYTDAWIIVDTVRGIVYGGDSNYLRANSSAAEDGSTFASVVSLTATGWQVGSQANYSGATYVYVAIRKGPMQTPSLGTSVLSIGTRTGSASIATTNSTIFTDLAITKRYTSATEYWAWTARLGGQFTLQSNNTDAILSGAMATNPWDTMVGAFCAASNGATNSGDLIDYSLKRAPKVFDYQFYTGNGTTQNISHNLAVVPEMMIAKRRDSAGSWVVYTATTGNAAILELSSTGAVQTSAPQWGSTTPTSSVFSLGTSSSANASGGAYMWLGFATLSGVSKVGTYTGNGSAQTINCGFTTGARFVLIKRTDSTGDWYLWDSVRGISSGTDPYLLINSTVAQVTGTNYLDTNTAGFQVTSSAPAAINASGGTFIFLAIA